MYRTDHHLDRYGALIGGTFPTVIYWLVVMVRPNVRRVEAVAGVGELASFYDRGDGERRGAAC